jgi:putative transcriptional regulator
MVRMKLNLLLAKHKLTQQELSLATGIRQGTLSNYINDNYKHLVKEHIETLCSFFDCEITDLIEYVKDKP